MTDIHRATRDGGMAAIGAVTALIHDRDDPIACVMLAELQDAERLAALAFLATTCAALLRRVCARAELDPTELLQIHALTYLDYWETDG